MPRSPGARPWGPTLVHVDVTALVGPSAPRGWSPAAVDAARRTVAALLQDHGDLDVVAIVVDARRGIRIAGPSEHRILLGAEGGSKMTQVTKEAPIVVSADGSWPSDTASVRVELSIGGGPGSGPGAVIHGPGNTTVRLDPATFGEEAIVQAIRRCAGRGGRSGPRPDAEGS